MTRDPRMDPQPGDVLSSCGDVRTVLSVKRYTRTTIVECSCGGPGMSIGRVYPWLAQFRKWANGAKVLQTVGENEKLKSESGAVSTF